MPAKDIWLRLADRHLRMARRLRDGRLYEGALFHTYHAFECVVSAGLAAHGHDPARPPNRYSGSLHVRKLNWFADEYNGQTVSVESSSLRVSLCGITGIQQAQENDLRNGCLYYCVGSNPPWVRFGAPEFQLAYARVRRFIGQHAPLL